MTHIMKKVQFSQLNSYGCDPLGKDDVYDIEVFRDYCMTGAFIDYDGYGEHVDENYYVLNHYGLIYPSEITIDYVFPKETKYVVWYNK